MIKIAAIMNRAKNAGFQNYDSGSKGGTPSKAFPFCPFESFLALQIGEEREAILSVSGKSWHAVCRLPSTSM